MIYAVGIMKKAGEGYLLGAKTATEFKPALQKQDFESSFGQIGAGHQSVWASANDDTIPLSHLSPSNLYSIMVKPIWLLALRGRRKTAFFGGLH